MTRSLADISQPPAAAAAEKLLVSPPAGAVAFLRCQACERRLTKARAEWERSLDTVRAECRAQLAEADQLLSLGFKKELAALLAALEPTAAARQTLLFR